MINFKKGKLNKKDKIEILGIFSEYEDEYRDFYLTKHNLRLFIKENKELFFECLRKGDSVIYSEEVGILFITGFSDKANRIYIKMLAKNNSSVKKLLQMLSWKIEDEVFIKLKKKNPIIKILQENGFIFRGDRGQEILLSRKNLNREK